MMQCSNTQPPTKVPRSPNFAGADSGISCRNSQSPGFGVSSFDVKRMGKSPFPLATIRPLTINENRANRTSTPGSMVNVVRFATSTFCVTMYGLFSEDQVASPLITPATFVFAINGAWKHDEANTTRAIIKALFFGELRNLACLSLSRRSTMVRVLAQCTVFSVIIRTDFEDRMVSVVRLAPGKE